MTDENIIKMINTVKKRLNDLTTNNSKYQNKNHKIAYSNTEQLRTDIDLMEIGIERTLTDMDLRLIELEVNNDKISGN